MLAPALLTAGSLAMLALVLVSEWRDALVLRYVSKPLASLCFVLIPVLCRGLDATGDYAAWVLVGLVLGALGDVALMFRSKRWFVAGLVSFLLGHVAYVVAFSLVVAPGAWLSPVALVPVLGAAIIMKHLWPHLGSMRVPVVAYVVTITVMVIGAVAIARSTPPARHILSNLDASLATVGAIAFFASDISVAQNRFVRERFLNRAWGLPAYYSGQLLMAWSTLHL